MPINTTIPYLQPTVIPSSPGDLEEARIRRATDLARLRTLQLEPNLEQQRLDLTRQGILGTQSYQNRQLQSETRGQDVTQRGQDLGFLSAQGGQDVTERGQDLGYATTIRGQDQTAQAEHGRVLTELLSSAFAQGVELPEGKQRFDTIAAAAGQAGFGELAYGALEQHKKQVAQTVQDTLSQLQNPAADATTRQAVLDNVKRLSPDAYQGVKATAPQYFPQDGNSVPTDFSKSNDPYIKDLLPTIQQRQNEENKYKAISVAQDQAKQARITQDQARKKARNAAGIYTPYIDYIPKFVP